MRNFLNALQRYNAKLPNCGTPLSFFTTFMIFLSSAVIRHSQTLSLRRKTKIAMKKSLLDIVQPRRKYNFSAYKKESYQHLQFLLDLVREKAQHLCQESVTSGEDEKGCPFVTFQSEEVIAEIQRYDSEIKYLERLVRIRRFWRPRDWFNAICEEFDYMQERLFHRRDMRDRKRIEAMTPEKRTRCYRKRVQSLEKKIIAIYASYAPEISSDCSFVTAHSIGTPEERRRQLEPLLSERSYILDQMFRATPAEVARLNEINDSLRQHVRDMRQQLIALYKTDVDYSRGKDLDEMYEAELFACPFLSESFEGADFYGSDFDKIIEIEYELLSDDSLEPIASMRIYPSENPSCDSVNLKIDNLDLFQDDDDWTECWTRVPALRDIKFCHSLHHMSDHQDLSLVDILHKTSFYINLKHEIGWGQKKNVD